MPTLLDLTTRVYRDLADDKQVVFTKPQVQDFVRAGMVEINRLIPLESQVDLILTSGVYRYIVNLIQPTDVDIRDPNTGVPIQTIPFANHPGLDGDGDDLKGRWGWAFQRTADDRGTIELPRSWIDQVTAMDPSDQPIIRVYGYAYRTIPYTDTFETGLGGEEEYALREFAKAQGFDLLSHDRSLFAQWQGQTNNTDVSPVMMMNMAATAAANWQRRRGAIRTLRRW